MSPPQFRLWDIATGEQVAGQQYVTEARTARRVAHLIGDAVFTRITGEKGFFDSPRRVRRRERLRRRSAASASRIMDMDGANVKYLTRGDKLVVTPRFSPSAQQIAYMSFGEADPKVSLLNLETGQRRGGRQLSRHDLLAALFAGRPEHRDVAVGGRHVQSLHDGSAHPHDDAPDRYRRHRHVAVLFARRLADRLRIRSRRRAADLCDERERRRAPNASRSAKDAIRRRSGRRAATLIAFTRQKDGQFRHRRDEARRLAANACSPTATTTKARPSRPTACS